MGSPAIIIGVGRKKGPPSMPPPEDGAPAKPKMGDDSNKPATPGKKASIAAAHKVGADQHCSNCTNYQAQSGECDKVQGMWEPDDACVRYFTPASGGEGSPDEEAGESPEYEASEQEPQQ